MEDNLDKRIMLDLETDNGTYTLFVENEVAARLNGDAVYRSQFLQALELGNSEDMDDSIDQTEATASPNQSKSETVKWSGKQAELLVSLRIENDLRFQMHKTHKQIWADIAKKMMEKGHQFTGVQCCNKWKSIKREYKAAVDHNSKTGNEPKTCKFFSELNELFGNKPSTRPTFTLDSSKTTLSSDMESCTSTSTDTRASFPSGKNVEKHDHSSFAELSSDSDDEKVYQINSTSKKQKRSKAQSKGSGIDKVIKWMDSYQIKQEELMQRQLDFLANQNKEKLKRMDRLCDILEKQ